MRKTYYISGDKTGITYGVWEWKEGNKPFDMQMVASGLKSCDACQKKIKELMEKDEEK